MPICCIALAFSREEVIVDVRPFVFTLTISRKIKVPIVFERF